MYQHTREQLFLHVYPSSVFEWDIYMYWTWISWANYAWVNAVMLMKLLRKTYAKTHFRCNQQILFSCLCQTSDKWAKSFLVQLTELSHSYYYFHSINSYQIAKEINKIILLPLIYYPFYLREHWRTKSRSCLISPVLHTRFSLGTCGTFSFLLLWNIRSFTFYYPHLLFNHGVEFYFYDFLNIRLNKHEMP
jgi:hypothetical protein